MTPRRISPATAILLLGAILGGSAERPAPGVRATTEQTVAAQTQKTETTRAPNTAPTYAQRIAEKVGKSGGNRGQRRNIKRQARRVLEKIGVIDSGRSWRNFRKLARSSPAYAELWQLALHVAKNRIPVRPAMRRAA